MIESIVSPLVNTVSKMLARSSITHEDAARIYKLPYFTRILEAGDYVYRYDETPNQCSILVSGFTHRHKLSILGHRQIVAINIPGEFLDLQQLYIKDYDSNVQALTRCEIATISHTAIRQLVTECPSIGHKLTVFSLIELSLAREWMLNIGRRDGRTKIAHFLCEFAMRLDRQELLEGKAYELPMTQEQLGDTVGLTAVHVNRMIKGLVKDGLVERSRRGITIPNWPRLVREAGFDSSYLHLND